MNENIEPIREPIETSIEYSEITKTIGYCFYDCKYWFSYLSDIKQNQFTKEDISEVKELCKKMGIMKSGVNQYDMQKDSDSSLMDTLLFSRLYKYSTKLIEIVRRNYV